MQRLALRGQSPPNLTIKRSRDEMRLALPLVDRGGLAPRLASVSAGGLLLVSGFPPAIFSCLEKGR